MRRQSWLIILLSVLVLLKGSGLYAMVHCQTMPQQSDMSTIMQMAASAETSSETNVAMTAAEHGPEQLAQSQLTPDHCHQNQLQSQDQHSNNTCQTCDHCCTIHAMAFPATLVLSQQDSHDKVQQYTYFHSSVFIPTQKRPPKFA
jgi:formylmethanofuran:tetrahydromethanopterin formyltransferase